MQFQAEQNPAGTDIAFDIANAPCTCATQPQCPTCRWWAVMARHALADHAARRKRREAAPTLSLVANSPQPDSEAV